MATADPGVGSFTPINIFGMLRKLVADGAPLLTNSGAPVGGASGTYAGQAGKGALLIDTTNGNLYINTNTLASPTWSFVNAGGSLVKSNQSVATVSAGFAADTYLAGSAIAVPAGGFIAGASYYCTFDMVKTAAGSAAFTVTLRIGTAGSTADTAILTFTFAVGTAAADTGTFELWAYFRTVGSGTSAVLVGSILCSHALAATGLVSTGAAGVGQVTAVSSGFDSTPANNIIGVSVNGGASFSGTNTLVKSELHNY